MKKGAEEEAESKGEAGPKAKAKGKAKAKAKGKAKAKAKGKAKAKARGKRASHAKDAGEDEPEKAHGDGDEEEAPEGKEAEAKEGAESAGVEEIAAASAHDGEPPLVPSAGGRDPAATPVAPEQVGMEEGMKIEPAGSKETAKPKRKASPLQRRVEMRKPIPQRSSFVANGPRKERRMVVQPIPALQSGAGPTQPVASSSGMRSAQASMR